MKGTLTFLVMILRRFCWKKLPNKYEKTNNNKIWDIIFVAHNGRTFDVRFECVTSYNPKWIILLLAADFIY